jgi:carbon monoxide dehydrogenase subunit G
MAINMSGEVVLPADKARVWAMLNDPNVLKVCIPGCETFERDGDNAFRAVTMVKVGPVSARFKGKVSLTDIDAPNSYKISGEGEGGVAGFAKGGAAVRLAEADGGGTRLAYDVEANVGGKIAQLGSRLIDSVAKKNADAFFAKFAQAVAVG